MARTVFVMTRGDTFIKSLELKNQLGSPLDLSGAKVMFTVKINITDPDSARLFQKNTANGGIFISDPVGGRLELRIDPPDTADIEGDFFFDLQIVKADNVFTVLNGILTVLFQITQSNTELV